MNLFQKLIEIRKEVIGFEKDTKGFNYTYVSGSQAIGKIRAKMDELGLVLIPKVGQAEHTVFNYQSWNKARETYEEKTDQIIQGDMAFVWVNAEKPDEQLEVPWKIYGQQDDISKAFGSGLTYSERYFILKFFQAPTDELDPDSRDTTGKTRGSVKKGNISEAQIKRLFAIANSKGYDSMSVKKAVLKKYSITEIANLSKPQYDEMCKGYEGLDDK